MRSVDEKFKTVIEKNTFYFSNPEFEEKYEAYLNSLNETLLVLKNKVETEGLRKAHIENLLLEKVNGLRALLALTGFSNESLKRLISVIRVVDNPELNALVCKDKWHRPMPSEEITEWSDEKIASMIKSNEYFRKGLVNIFFEGSTVPFLANAVPLFELKKLSISKLRFEIPAMIDTLIRYKEKGSRAGMGFNNPETLIAAILSDLKLSYESGDLGELIDNAPDKKRTMDFIIPSKKDPRVIVESSFLVTTSSGQGDKSKTEISIDSLIKNHYPKAKFIGFVDGIGWYVRKGDLKRMVGAYVDVFTFHKDELARFKQLLLTELPTK
jgi:hypothetical protein